MSIERRALGGTVIGAAAFVTNAAQTFLLVPLLLSAWGAERYGSWLALQALVTLVATLDVGHQGYVGNELAKLYFSDQSALRRTLASALWTAAAIGGAEVVVAFGLGAFGLLPRALGLSPAVTEREQLYPALVFFTATWALAGSVGGVVVRLLPPAGKFVRGTGWALFGRIAQTLAIAGAVLAGFGILGTIVVSQLAVLAYCAALFWDLRRQFAWLWPMHRAPSASLGAHNFARSLVLTGTSTLTQLQQNGLNLLVTGMLGAAVLPVLSTARTVASTFLQASNILGAPLAPEMVRFHMNREYGKLTAIFAANWLVGGTVIQLGILAALPTLAPLYALWTRHALPFDRTLFALLAFAVALRSFGAPLLTYLGSINHLRALSAMNTAQTIVVLGAAAFGMRSLGLRAAGIGVLGGEIVGSCALPIVFTVTQFPRQSRAGLLRHAALAMAPTLVTAVALLSYARHAPLGRVVGLATLAASPLVWAQWRELPSDVRERLRKLLSRLVRRESSALKGST
jgi:O-antigen/teichoic acid export membrane protein